MEDGFHGCLLFFDKKLVSFPCCQKTANATVSYIKGVCSAVLIKQHKGTGLGAKSPGFDPWHYKKTN